MFRTMFVLTLLMGGVVLAGEELNIEGTVQAVNFEARKLTITHRATKELSGATTRDFTVQDPGMLEEIQPGNTIKFSAQQQSDGSFMIIDFEVVSAPLLKNK